MKNNLLEKILRILLFSFLAIILIGLAILFFPIFSATYIAYLLFWNKVSIPLFKLNNNRKAIAVIVLLCGFLSFGYQNRIQPSLQNGIDATGTITQTPSVVTDIPLDTNVVQAQQYKVTKIVDGDTIELDKIGKVRLIGIDSPETNECYFQESTNYMSEKLMGKTVTVEMDPTQGDKDKYDRTLAYVFLTTSSKSVNYLAVKNGFAFEYTYDKPYKYQDEFQKAQSDAKASALGLWALISCSGSKLFPTQTPLPLTATPIPQVVDMQTNTTANSNSPSSSIKYTCSCSKSCTQIKSCEEAYYQLDVCGCSARDGDDDGIPCESLCK